MKRSLTMRLMLLFSLLLAAFTVLTAVIYNALMVRQSITHHSQAMQRDAFAIAQNLSELVAPSAYDASLDETRFIVSEENLPPLPRPDRAAHPLQRLPGGFAQQRDRLL